MQQLWWMRASMTCHTQMNPWIILAYEHTVILSRSCCVLAFQSSASDDVTSGAMDYVKAALCSFFSLYNIFPKPL